GETLVQESPSFENINGLGIFSRTFEVGAGATALTHLLCSEIKAKTSPVEQRGGTLVRVNSDGTVTAFALAGTPAATLATSGSDVTLRFPPRTEILRAKLLIWSGAKDKLAEFEKT